MAYTQVSGAFAVKYSGSGTVQTDNNSNMSGVDFVVIETGARTSDTITISDSNGNTYSPLTKYSNSGDFGSARLYYNQGGTYGNPFWVKSTGAADVCAIAFVGFSGSAASPFDTQAGIGGTGGGDITLTTGATSTLSQTGELIVTGDCHYSTSTASAPAATDGTYTITTLINQNVGSELNLSMGYAIASGTTAPNVTWGSSTGGRMQAVNVAAFKPGAGGGGVVIPPKPLRLGQAVNRSNNF